MMRFIHIAGSRAFYRADAADYLSAEGNNVRIVALSLTVTSGDVVLGSGSDAAVIGNDGTSVDFWLSAGSVNSRLLMTITLTNTESFPYNIDIAVRRA